jgi:hypothetical protein
VYTDHSRSFTVGVWHCRIKAVGAGIGLQMAADAQAKHASEVCATGADVLTNIVLHTNIVLLCVEIMMANSKE